MQIWETLAEVRKTDSLMNTIFGGGEFQIWVHYNKTQNRNIINIIYEAITISFKQFLNWF